MKVYCEGTMLQGYSALVSIFIIALMNYTMFLKFIFFVKTIHVSDETSSIVSCTVRNEKKICNK